MMSNRRQEVTVRSDMRVWTCLALLLALVSVEAGALPVEVSNPGAERSVKGRPEAPAGVGTYVTPGATAAFTRDTTVKRSGDASFHIRNNGSPTEPQGGYNAIFMIEIGDILPGHTYTISADVKTDDVRAAGFDVRMRAGGGFMEAGRVRKCVSGVNDWTRITAECSPPPGATGICLMLVVTDKGGAWFDDIEITDNFEELIGGTFTRRRQELEGLREQAVAVGTSDDVAQVDKAVAQATKMERQTAHINADSRVSPERRRRLTSAREALESRVVRLQRRLAATKARDDAVRLTGEETPPFVVGFAPPTARVFLQDRPFSIEVTDTASILAVRGEREAIQLVILPLDQDLEDVQVSVGELAGPGGRLPSDAVTVNPVGYVNIRKAGSNPYYSQEPLYLGWWPDPLLPNFAFDVKEGDTQPVWISVRVPRETKPGTYTGDVFVRPANAPEQKVALAVEVADVDLPEAWHFRNLLCFDEGYGRMIYGSQENWEALRDKFNDFLLDRRINLGGLSGDTQKRLSVDDMIAFAKRGQNVIFTYQFAWNSTMTDANGVPVTQLPRKIHEWMPKLKQAGVADRAIVYGWDEQGPDRYPAMRIAAELLARDYPGLPLIMAGVDTSCGTASILGGLPSIAFCPLIPEWNPEAVAKAKADGNAVWWYTIFWNMEQHLIRSRLIPWQSYKVGADGFLIWCMNRWLGNDKPISSEKIRSDWNPYLDGGYPNSTAMYIYPGEEGPVSSLRLENFADGVEDYDLLVAARDALATLDGRSDVDPAVIGKLQAALRLEDAFVKDGVTYSTDPELLARHRRMLIKALEAARPYTAAKPGV